MQDFNGCGVLYTMDVACLSSYPAVQCPKHGILQSSGVLSHGSLHCGREQLALADTPVSDARPARNAWSTHMSRLPAFKPNFWGS